MGAFVMHTRESPRQDALDEAATIATWADARTPEWIRALGGLAEMLDDPALERRFHDGLELLATDDERMSDDLEVVIRQARQRNLTKTAEAAVRVRGCDIPSDDDD